jgi:outer membrane immunogenic protein
MPSLAPAAAPARYSWTGAYVGLEGGYSWAHSAQTFDDPVATFDEIIPAHNPTGWLAGIEGGANYQFSNGVVVGIEADAAFDGVTDRIPDNLAIDHFAEPNASVTTKTDATGNVRGRLGYAFGRTLIFGTGGLAIAHETVHDSPSDLNDQATLIGWNVGGGVEQALTERISAKVEYQYSAFGSHTWFPGEFYSSSGSASSNTVRAGLNFHF